MPDRLSLRWLALTGPLAAVLLALGFFVLQPSTPGIDDSGKEVVEFYSSHEGRAVAAAFMVAIAGALVVLFASHLRAATKVSAAPHAARSILLAGSAVYAVGVVIPAGLHLSLVDAANNGAVDVASTLNYLDNGMWLGMIVGAALTLIGAGLSVLRSGILPSWLGWVAVVVGVISLAGPGGFLGFFVFPIWLLVAGVLVFLRDREPGAAPVA